MLPLAIIPGMPARFRLSRWVPVFCWMVVIFMASTDSFSAGHTRHFFEPLLLRLFPWISPQAFDLIHLCIRKGAHLIAYGILGILLWRAIPEPKRHPGGGDWRRAGAALAVATFYGATDEFHQRFVPSRGASVDDVLTDACGAALALAILLVARKMSQKGNGTGIR